MSEVPVTNALPLAWVQQAIQNPTNFLQTLDGLLENFGAEAIGNASAQKFLKEFTDGLKDMIDNSDLPDGIKRMANAMVDQHLSDMCVACACSSEVADAVDNSELGDEVSESAQESVGEMESASASGASSSAREAADAALDDQMAGLGESSETKKKKGGGGRNFLEILADSMGQTQAKFLNEALEHSQTMESLAGNSERADDFTVAQSKYTAAMQMFNIYSNQVATTLKTLGEAMSAIARKQ